MPIFHKVRSTVTVRIYLKINEVTVLRTLEYGLIDVFYKRGQSYGLLNLDRQNVENLAVMSKNKNKQS